MNSACIREADLPLLATLLPSDPKRLHLQGCARCRARLAALSAFLDPPAPAEGARADEAEAALGALLDREIFGARGPMDAVRGRGSRDEGLGAFFRLLWRPALRPVWAVGILLLAIVGVRELRESGDDRIVLREERDTSAGTVAPAEPAWTADGKLELRWTGPADADRYLVVLYGDELEETGRIEADAAARCLLPEAMVQSLREGVPLFWRVVALRAGDRIASSAMTPLRLPRER